MDVHKDTIAVAVAYCGRSKPKSLGIIANTKKSLLKLIAKLSPNGEVLGFSSSMRRPPSRMLGGRMTRREILFEGPTLITGYDGARRYLNRTAL